MMKIAPDPIDVQDLQFKLHCRIKVFENSENAVFSRHCSLVASASRFGLTFVGSNSSNIQAIVSQHVEKSTECDIENTHYPRRTLPLPSPPSHISVNCEHTVLAVVLEKNGRCCALFYDVKSFWQEDILQVGEVCLSSTTGVYATETNWNPALGAVFTACKSDGSLGIYEIKNSGVGINELPAAAGATCFSWSPKGKQIAVGSRDGKITQLKPDLKAVKVINAPPLKEPHLLLSLQWVSNYQFIGVFQPPNPDSQAAFIVIDAPKSGEPTFTNYDDICYGNGCARPTQFYMILLQGWNIVMAASSNSMEVGVLGNNGELWSQWIMGDAARAELPLSAKHQETLPIGCALDVFYSVPPEDPTLQPTPFLLLLSHHGVLCCFNVINMKQGIPSVTCPADAVTLKSGLRHFITSTEKQSSKLVSEPSKVNQQLTNQFSSAASIKTPSIITTTTVSKVQPQVTTVTQAMNLSQNPSMNLFGGQATLTPITQPNKSGSSSFISQYHSILPSSSSNTVKSMTTTGAQIIPSIATPTTAVSKPVATVASNVAPSNTLKLSQVETSDDFNKTDVISIDLKADEEAEKIFAQMVKEECIFLESEVKAVLHQGKKLKYNLGSDADKTNIVENTRSLEEFFHEVAEICVTQSAEVHILKQNLLQSWAWYEEAKSRHLASEDESMMMLIRDQPLDSASEKQLATIQHTNYYLESQISQAHMALDEQWESFQDYCKKTHKLQIPTMEIIFQTMVKQNAILQKQSYILKDIARRMKSHSRSGLGPSLLISVGDVKSLPNELKLLKLNTEDIRHEYVVKDVSKKKADSLRSFLKRRTYPHISAGKPQLSTSVIQASPASKLKQYSFSKVLAGRDVVPKKLDFVQSTPMPATVKNEPDIQSSTPIEGLQDSALKFEAHNFSNRGDKTFLPLAKNLIASSPHSAFVPTFGNNTFTSTGTLSSATVSVTKSVPSCGAITISPQTGQPIISISNLSKPFSFAGSSTSPVVTHETPTVVSKHGLNLFSNSGATSTSTLNTEMVSNKSSIFGMVDKNMATIRSTTSIFNVSKPSTSVPNVNTASSTKPATVTTSASLIGSLKTPVTSSFVLNSSTSTTTPGASFSFGASSASSIFATASQNATNKPFIFSSKTTDPPATIAHQAISNSPQSSFSTSSTTSKGANFIQSSIFSTSAINPLKTTISSSEISTSAPITITPKLGPVSSAVPLILNSSVPTTSKQTSVFSLNTTKAPLFPTSSSLTVTSAGSGATDAAVFTTLESVVSSASATDVTNSSVSASVSDQSVTTKNIFSSTGSSNLSSTLSGPSATGFTVDSTSSNKPLALTNTDATVPKPSLFGNSVSGTSAATLTTSAASSVFDVTPSTIATSLGTVASTTQSSTFATPPATATTGTTAAAVTSQSSIFGAASSLSTSFGVSSTSSTKPSLFGSVSSTSVSSTSTSVFGSITKSTTQSSIFGVASSTTALGIPTGSTAQSSIFGAVPSTSATSFGTTTTSTTETSLFAATAPVSTTFGTSSASTKQPSIFGTSSLTTTTTTSIFGPPPVTAATTTTASIFGTAPVTTATTAASIFGTPPATTATPIFGTPTSTVQPLFGSGSTNQSSVFGGAVNSTASQSVFGNSTSTTSQSSQGFGLFGDGGQKPSIFGTPTTTQASIFGGSNQSTVFGNTASTTSSTFGQNQSSHAFGQPSVFGSSGTSFGTSSVFGTSAPSFGQSTGSIFGGAPTTTAGSIFGTTATTGNTFAPSGTVFGTPVSSTPTPFGSGSVFSSNTTQPSSFSATAGTGAFGFGNLNVGTAATTSTSGFGSGSSPNPFGGDNKNVFGGSTPSSGNSLFGSGGGSVFGSPPQGFNSGFGSQSPFGQQSSFSQSSFGNNTFGQSPTGPFSGGTSGGVGQTGFGTATNQFQKPGGFGNSPVFGGSPSFGTAPSFGGAPAFGSPPSFGSGSKIFGSSNPGFGAAVGSQNAGFGNLANQQTVGFGNLAQQAANAPTQNAPFSGSSSFSSWR